MEQAQKHKTRQKAFLVCLVGTDCVLNTMYGRVFDEARSCLRHLQLVADLVLLTNVNVRSAYSEWRFYDLPDCTAVCLKRREAAHCLETLMEQGYERKRVLVIGCGEQALEAAQKNKVLYYPIFPGQENLNWHMLQEEGMPKLLHGTYWGDYQNMLLARHKVFLGQQ